MLDLQGTDLQQNELELLQHPYTGGVILFTRNYSDIAQLTELTRRIHEIKQPELLIAVDHEGGRVQRFKREFTRLPPCGCYGSLYDKNPAEAQSATEMAGWLLASELLSVGIDFSFAPVLDLDSGKSSVIGDRAFHKDCDVVSQLGRAFVRGLNSAGMAAVAKHFPGHGSVVEDSHETLPVDKRRFEDVLMSDLVPFERLINAGIAGIMPAHVVYPEVDTRAAGYSRIWLQDILRGNLGFHGAIFSDDISMGGAAVIGGPVERAQAALSAGCDMVLVCNDHQAAAEILDKLKVESRPDTRVRMMRMYGKPSVTMYSELMDNPRWKEAVGRVASLDLTPELDLDDDEVPI